MNPSKPVVASALLTITLTLLTSAAQETPPRSGERHFEIAGAQTTDLVSMALSPDGRTLAFVGNSQGRQLLWTQRLNAAPETGRPFPGTDNATFPFWAPDSRSLGYFVKGSVKRLDTETGVVQTMANFNTGVGRGGAWARNGAIVCAFAGRATMFRISDATFTEAASGTRGLPPNSTGAVVTDLVAGQAQHLFPFFLPDDRHFLYYATGSAATRGIYVGSIDGSQATRLVDADAAAIYADPERILYVRGGTLFAQPFDPRALKVTGPATPVAEYIVVSENAAAISASAAGQIVYRSDAATHMSTGADGSRLTIRLDIAEAIHREFKWFDRTGQEVTTMASPPQIDGDSPSLSRDGRQLAFERTLDGNQDIWLLDTQTAKMRRFTTDPAPDAFPIWSPDGSQIVFSSNRSGTWELYVKAVLKDETETRIARSASVISRTPPRGGIVNGLDWSANGQWLLFRSGAGIYSISLSSGADAFRDSGSRQSSVTDVLNLPMDFPEIAPNGNWLAYQYNNPAAAGGVDIRIVPWPLGAQANAQIVGGGKWPRWRPDGKELFYVAPDSTLMAVPFDNSRAGRPTGLFAPPMRFASGADPRPSNYGPQYMVSSNGKGFVVLASYQAQSPIHVIENWRPR